MSIQLQPGTRLLSAVCKTELIAVKAPDYEVDLTIGGFPPVLVGVGRMEGPVPLDGHDTGTAIGKRYADAVGALEFLCTKAGDGVPAVDGVVLRLKDAKPLPASD